ncbi:hypothetical protein DYB35_009435 [Aphanomyces astaci]|uniref:Abnormal spindle-like microcephaly-associated protein ASH domain-containing protein n=1 Tax=Aphanomyces astaci TaxID=112090 RepID=A0A418D2M3_APHAT|nr:hypothetical protein DYB35_009435 [Aphanomyces astaci]
MLFLPYILGVLQPHESLVLSLSYSYESLQYDGIHDLSVVLNVSQGKKLTLILHGRTLPVSTPLLFLPSDVCVLHPVQVGQSMRSTYPLAKPCTQQIPVFNCGDQPLQVDIDDSSWSVLNARQFNFPILECRTSRVVVPAHATAFIDVDFCPLQNITYTSELRLYATALHSENTYEQSTTISVAMAELPLEPPTPVFVQFNSTKRAAKASRLCDDVKRLTATVLENTMFNLIQEIACGEFDLTCLPKQLVFHNPDHDDDNDTVETIQENRE